MINHLAKVSGGSVEDYLSQLFGERFMEYRRLWHLPEKTGEPLAFPVHLDFELIDACNQKCLMCPRNDSNLVENSQVKVNTKQRMSFDTFCRIIDEATAKGTKSINIGAFAEPLIHPDLICMLKYAHEHGIIDSLLITNGVLLNSRISKEILESGLTRLYVSVDAFNPETYRKIRGSGFDKVKENLLRFIQLREQVKNGGLPWIRVSFVDMPQNAAEKADFINYWRDKADHIDIQKYWKPDIAVDQEVMKRPKRHICLDPWRRLAIRASGDILPCCTFRGEMLRLGNIRDVTLEEVWRSASIRAIRDGITKNSLDVCAVCQRI